MPLNQNDDTFIAEFVKQLTERYKQLTPNLAGAGADRRRSKRRPFLSIQAIASCVQGGIPTKLEFRAVQCRDLSNHGFSFWIEEPPSTEQIVAQFRLGSKNVYIKAVVVHVSKNPYAPTPQFIVGCAFMERCDL